MAESLNLVMDQRIQYNGEAVFVKENYTTLGIEPRTIADKYNCIIFAQFTCVYTSSIFFRVKKVRPIRSEEFCHGAVLRIMCKNFCIGALQAQQRPPR